MVDDEVVTTPPHAYPRTVISGDKKGAHMIIICYFYCFLTANSIYIQEEKIISYKLKYIMTK